MRKKLTKRDLERLERALCALVDYEGAVKDALSTTPGVRNGQWALHDVCAGLRKIVDGD